MFSVLALLAPLAVVAAVASPLTSSEALAERDLPELCSSTSVCSVMSINHAPALRTDVCWDGYRITLKGTGACTEGGRAYSITHGIVVDPLDNLVLPIAAVPDTCDAGFCVGGGINAGTILTDGIACCNPKTGSCTAPDEDGQCGANAITWCESVEDNGDGTVTCHE